MALARAASVGPGVERAVFSHLKRSVTISHGKREFALAKPNRPLDALKSISHLADHTGEATRTEANRCTFVSRSPNTQLEQRPPRVGEQQL